MPSVRSRLPRALRRWTLLAEEDARDPVVRVALGAIAAMAIAARTWPQVYWRFAVLWATPFLLAEVARRLGAARVRGAASAWIAQGDRAGSLGFYSAIIGGQFFSLALCLFLGLVALGIGLPANTGEPAVRAFDALVIGGALLSFALGALVPRFAAAGWLGPGLTLSAFYVLSGLAPHDVSEPGFAGRFLLIWGGSAALLALIGIRRGLRA